MSNAKSKPRFTRRGFLKGAGYAAAGLTVTYLVGRNFAPILPSLATPEIKGEAWITVSPDGKVSMLSPVHEMGQGSSLGLAQIVAEELNVDIATITVKFPSTRDIPHMRFTTGSEAIALHARPVAEAAASLREELRRKAAVITGLNPEALKDTTGGFTTEEDRYLTYADIVGGSELTLAEDNLPASHAYTFDASRKKRQIGRTALQVQALEIVTGGPIFAGDIRRPNMAFGRAVQAPAPDARIIEIHDGGADTMPGVIQVVIDVPRGLVGVVAETPGALDNALEQIEVKWDRPGSFSAEDIAAQVDVDTALSSGRLEHSIVDDDINTSEAWTVDMRFDLPILHHATQEPRTAVAEFSLRNGQEVVDIWTGTQDIFVNQKKAAADLDWSPDRVTIHAMRVGGGFGGRVLYDVVREAVLLAQHVKRPVKVHWSRRDEFLADRTRPPSSHRVQIRTDTVGHITDWRHACVSGHVLLTELMAPQPLLSVMRMAMHDFGASRELVAPYNAQHRRIEMSDVELPFHAGEWRSLGACPNVFAIESAIDELARKLGKNPVEFRLQNLGSSRVRLKNCLSRVKAMCDTHPHQSIPGIGRGFACGIYQEHSYVAAAFDVVVDYEQQEIRAERCYVALDVGLAISPDQIKAQIEGCAMMAIGQLLMETAPIDDSGLASISFSDYPTPLMGDTPEFEIEIIDNSSIPPAGVGQAPIIATVPALANAIRDATGYRTLKLPVSFDDLPIPDE
ncbi:molybdopterin cofactor-binding domain-containing protein [Kiloniella sp. EL199]|uniref:xanthine dehydrogenase family protein molybdopterin-binding subunit n=1 Tax=Kiloniella sp. EL199 TaxID=2107581 RepID=UPI0013C48ABD|nr:molybdopterin cofactor-binding domain-containing protein [Kiloniella sp. EL199]